MMANTDGGRDQNSRRRPDDQVRNAVRELNDYRQDRYAMLAGDFDKWRTERVGQAQKYTDGSAGSKFKAS